MGEVAYVITHITPLSAVPFCLGSVISFHSKYIYMLPCNTGGFPSYFRDSP